MVTNLVNCLKKMGVVPITEFAKRKFASKVSSTAKPHATNSEEGLPAEEVAMVWEASVLGVGRGGGWRGCWRNGTIRDDVWNGKADGAHTLARPSPCPRTLLAGGHAASATLESVLP